MKTIKEGTIPTPPPERPWFVEVVVPCTHCGAEVELDATDEHLVTYIKPEKPKLKQRPGEKIKIVQTAVIKIPHCPTCDKPMETFIPDIENP